MLDNNFGPNLRKITLLRDQIKNWDVYPFNVPSIKNLTEINLHNKICFFVGENGTGKSTLVEAIAESCGYGKEGGSRNIYHKTAGETAYSATQLAGYIKLSWTKKILSGYFLRAESFFNIASYLDELQKDDPGSLRAYGGKSLHKQSHGEGFLSLFQNRFSGKGFYILDEPEAALSPQRQLSFLALLHDIVGRNKEVQFIIATHSPILLAYPDAQILSFDNSGIGEIKYQNTQPYQITSTFLANPASYFQYLFEPERQ